MDADGRLLVVYQDRTGVYARTGAVGSPLEAAQRVSGASGFTVAAAIDDTGTATIVFAGTGGLLTARARRGHRFPRPTVAVAASDLSRHAAPIVEGTGLAAGGRTTALAWPGLDGRLRVSLARGAGGFARSQPVSAPPRGRNANQGSPSSGTVAVDHAGDVVFVYRYGNAVHATQRRAGSARFAPAGVISALRPGRQPDELGSAVPRVVLLADRTPLVGYDAPAGTALLTTRLTGPPPNLTAPRARLALLRDPARELRTANAVRVAVRCSQRCSVRGHATLHSPSGTTVDDELDARVLRPGATLLMPFRFAPHGDAGRAGRARRGAHVTISIRVENASGVSEKTIARYRLPAIH
jgi:hypothetical protein